MSIIGIYDYDMVTYTHVPFNLELMKLSAYYKKKRDIVIMTRKIDFDKYTKIVYRKDYYDGKFESEILSNPNIEYGGFAFNPTQYAPLAQEIECLKPDRYIYEPMRKIFCTDKNKERLFNQMMRAQHIRLSLDGKTIWEDYAKQLDYSQPMITFIFHDYNLADIKGSIDVIKQILKAAPGNQEKYVGIKFPIKPHNEQELIEWATLKPMTLFYNIEYNNNFTDEGLVKFIDTQKGTSISSQTKWNFTAKCNSTQDLVEKIPYIYKQMIYLRNHKAKMSLIYDTTKFGTQWNRVLDLIIHYYNQAFEMSKKDFERIVPYDSMYSLVSKFKEKEDYTFHFKGIENKMFTKQEARDTFKFVQSNCYELFQEFYECHNVELKGGFFQYD